MTKHENKLHPATIGIHGGPEYRTPGAPVVPPITQSATFHWATPADGELLYSRYGNNPNQLHVGAKAAALEGTEAAVALGRVITRHLVLDFRIRNERRKAVGEADRHIKLPAIVFMMIKF